MYFGYDADSTEAKTDTEMKIDTMEADADGDYNISSKDELVSNIPSVSCFETRHSIYKVFNSLENLALKFS